MMTISPMATNVGIVAMEIYFPKQCVEQTELEKFDGVSTGKYTVGLGQDRMAFCHDFEDINSICLTVVKNLLEKYNISPSDIGRLEVGTETIIDKSKSVKSCLMQLFRDVGNHSIEGIDTTNACYGGTSAFFNALAWVESSFWDGRFAIVVAGDIAVYASGNARPTGGAGAVAMLIGPNAPIVVDKGLRGTFMDHVYDFYKPDLSSEYPEVDGKLTVKSFLHSLDMCYRFYLSKFEKLFGVENANAELFDFMVFHSPYTKLVQKAWGRLGYNDFLRGRDLYQTPELLPYHELSEEESYENKELEKSFMTATRASFQVKVKPSLTCAKELGNMYCGSLYGGLISLVSEFSNELHGKRVGMFSYGSGSAASMFSVSIVGDISRICQAVNLKERLASRSILKPAVFDQAMELRDRNHQAKDYRPEANMSLLFPKSYYLVHVDHKFRRTYAYHQ